MGGLIIPRTNRKYWEEFAGYTNEKLCMMLREAEMSELDRAAFREYIAATDRFLSAMCATGNARR